MRHYTKLEDHYMARCLELAAKGRGTTSPNPLVGAVVLDASGRKISEGHHIKAGGHHAEVVALNAAGEAARGGTLLINLEPCNHTGKTPPCTELIIQSGIERVICGTLDPNPLVSGSGRDKLQNNRISVRYGFLEAECLKLNEIFFHHIRTQRPFVTLKMAATLDGRTATRAGKSQWLTGPITRRYVHFLRSAYDAILTTAETVSADNPQLTVRDVPGHTKNRQPLRIILDRRFRLNPPDYQIFNTKAAPTLVFTSKIHHNFVHAQLARKQGAEVIEVDETGLGLDLDEIFRILGERQITSVFVEAGSHLAGNLLSQNHVNKLYLFYAPKLLPDAMARSLLSGGVNLSLPDVPQLTISHVQQLDEDILVEAYPRTKAPESMIIVPLDA